MPQVIVEFHFAIDGPEAELMGGAGDVALLSVTGHPYPDAVDCTKLLRSLDAAGAFLTSLERPVSRR
jgi:hypothetical protein